MKKRSCLNTYCWKCRGRPCGRPR